MAYNYITCAWCGSEKKIKQFEFSKPHNRYYCSRPCYDAYRKNTLTKHQKWILSFLQQGSEVTTGEAAELCETCWQSAGGNLKKMERLGLVVKTEKGRWQLK